jgi:hypothetical protein
VARAQFYFFTVYRNEALAADPGFFEVQKSVLRAWHEADPADAAEYERTCAIAPHQDDKVNPFVIDPTLVDRAYFDTTPVEVTAFTVSAGTGGVLLEWTTRFERDHAGFHVVRTGDGAETRLTRERIPARSRYAFLDRTGRPGVRYDYWIDAVDRAGGRERTGPRSFVYPPIAPRVVVHPNPLRVGESVRIELPSSEPATADLFDLRGRRVRGWARLDPAVWDGTLDSGRPASPGVYFLRVRWGALDQTVRLVVLR